MTDAELKIKLSLEADTAGAQETKEALSGVTSGLEGVEKATEKATESSHSLQGEQLGSLRTAHHLFEGLTELGEGGGQAVRGLATETRILGEVFESALGPIGPAVVIISTLLSVGLAEAFRNSSKAGKESAEDTKESFKTATDAMKDTLEFYIQAGKKSLDELGKAQAAADLAFTQGNASYDHRVAAQIALLENQRKLTEEVLKESEAREQANNKEGAVGAETIKEKYEALRERYDGQAKVKELGYKQQQGYLKNQELGDQLTGEETTRDQRQKTADDLKKNSAEAIAAATALGVTADPIDPEKKGARTYQKEFDALHAVLKGQYEDLQSLTDPHKGYSPRALDIEQDLLNKGKIGTTTPSDVFDGKVAAVIMDRIGETVKKIRAAQTAADTSGALVDEGPKVASDLVESGKKISDLTEQVQQNQESLIKLASDLQLAKKEQADADSELLRKNAQAQRNLSDRDFDANADTRIAQDETIIKDKNRPADDRAKAAIDAANARADKLQRKLDDSTRVGSDKPLTDVEITAKKAEIVETRGGGADQAAQITTQAQKQTAEKAKTDTAATTKAEETEITGLKGKVEASGNKELIASVKHLLQGVVDKQQELSILHAELAGSTANALTVIDQKLAHGREQNVRVERAVHSLSNGGNN